MTKSKSESSKRRQKASSASSSEPSANQPVPTQNPIPQEILDKLPPELKAIFEQSGIQVSTEILMSMAMYRGPWPPAPMLAEYEQHFPGWGIKMLELTEKQVNHRQELERKQVDRAENRMDAGQKFGFAVGALSIFAGAAIAIFAPSTWGNSLAAIGVVVVGVGGPAVARILATKFNWPSSKTNEKAAEKEKQIQRK